MANVILETKTAQAAFPIGTADTPWTFALTGTNADGTAFTFSQDNTSPSLTIAWVDGVTATLSVTKNGITAGPSLPYTFTTPTTVMLTVPDAAQVPTITAV